MPGTRRTTNRIEEHYANKYKTVTDLGKPDALQTSLTEPPSGTDSSLLDSLSRIAGGITTSK